MGAAFKTPNGLVSRRIAKHPLRGNFVGTITILQPLPIHYPLLPLNPFYSILSKDPRFMFRPRVLSKIVIKLPYPSALYPQQAWIPVPKQIRGRLAMNRSGLVLQAYRRVITAADEAAYPGTRIDRIQQSRVNIQL